MDKRPVNTAKRWTQRLSKTLSWQRLPALPGKTGLSEKIDQEVFTGYYWLDIWVQTQHEYQGAEASERKFGGKGSGAR
jgi:hypothetical protein